jgi:hypothetical protein
MDTPRPLTPAEKLRVAFGLFDAGVALMRAQLVRRHPRASPDEIERLLQEWLLTRPGAEHGDVAGRVRVRPLPAGPATGPEVRS